MSKTIDVLSPEEQEIIRKYRAQDNSNPNYILSDFDSNMRRILDDGFDMDDRTGVGVRTLPAVLTTIDISERIPVTTRRKTAWKSMLKEYLWFLSGSSNIKDLQEMGSKVWDFWKDDEFTSTFGFEEGSIGYGYGPNLINFGGSITNPKVKGFNQIDYVINEIKTNPKSRRILFNMWRPDKLDQVKLPCCHVLYQWVIDTNTNKISCVFYSRSADMFVGACSTNLQGAAFYTYMIAQQTGYTPDKLYHCAGHAHIYHNHIDLVEEYLSRPKPNSPILTLNHKDSMYDYNSDDFVLSDYNPLERMKVPIAV